MASTSQISGGPVSPVDVLYCAICSYPPEYCEYSSKSSKCKKWLQDEHPDLYSKYYSEEAVTTKLSELTVEQREALEKDLAKKERKEEKKLEKEAEKLASSKVVIKRIERNKRKYVTGVWGLEKFDVDLKKAAKLFANKFATGASVTKNNQGEDEIHIQGDVAYEVEEMLLDEDDKKAVAVFNNKVGEDQVEIIDEKLKKKTPS